MVVLGWVLALLRQREGNEPIDHYLIIAVWTLPVTMMLAGLIYMPLAVLRAGGPSRRGSSGSWRGARQRSAWIARPQPRRPRQDRSAD